MRGTTQAMSKCLTVLHLNVTVPVGHPLRAIQPPGFGCSGKLYPLFDELREQHGQPGIPPEQLSAPPSAAVASLENSAHGSGPGAALTRKAPASHSASGPAHAPGSVPAPGRPPPPDSPLPPIVRAVLHRRPVPPNESQPLRRPVACGAARVQE